MACIFFIFSCFITWRLSISLAIKSKRLSTVNQQSLCFFVERNFVICERKLLDRPETQTGDSNIVGNFSLVFK